MMKHFKKIAAFLAVAVLFVVLGVAVTAAEAPKLTIEMKNLKLVDNVQIMYAVPVEEGIDTVSMQVWHEDDYLSGGEPTVLSGNIRTIEGKDYWVFIYTKLAAKQMTDNVYAQAFAEVNGETIYGKTEKYSILQYAYNKLNDDENTSSALRDLLNQMLNYGAYSQRYFDYKTDRLAGRSFSQITVVGGTLYDGFSEGLFYRGETVTLYAPETNEAGETFTGWVDEDGRKIRKNTITVSWRDATYTAVYGEDWGDGSYSYGLEYRLSDDNSYYIVSDMGACTDTEIIIPSTYEGLPVKEISGGAFTWESDITSVRIPNSVESILGNAFEGCSSLQNIVLEDGNEAYHIVGNCLIETNSKTLIAGWGDVTIPEDGSVETIGRDAFCGNYNLTNVKIPNTVKTISSNAFYDSSLESIEIPSSVTSIEAGTFSRCTSLTSIAVAEDNSVYRCVNNCLIDTATKKLIVVLENGIIPTDGSVEIFTTKAFTNIDAITGIKIPDGVKTIEGDFGEFYDLSSIEIPQSVTDIYARYFYYLKDIYYAGTKAEWKALSQNLYIDENIAVHCSDGKVVPELLIFSEYWDGDGICYYVNGVNKNKENPISVIEIPAAYDDIPVKGIAPHAFDDCWNLKKVSLPAGLTYIGSYAFRCEKLTSIQFAGTTAEWAAIQKVDGWDTVTGEYTITCTDGTLDKNGAQITTPAA